MPLVKLWRCLWCAHVIDLAADDYCPVCGVELPEVAEVETPKQKADREWFARINEILEQLRNTAPAQEQGT